MVLWVFGYGSLIWNPGFEFDEKIIGFIKDYRRDLGHEDDYVIELANEVRKVLDSLKPKSPLKVPSPTKVQPLQSLSHFLPIKPLSETTVAVDS